LYKKRTIFTYFNIFNIIFSLTTSLHVYTVGTVGKRYPYKDIPVCSLQQLTRLNRGQAKRSRILAIETKEDTYIKAYICKSTLRWGRFLHW
jgi:hypothetical protein